MSPSKLQVILSEVVKNRKTFNFNIKMLYIYGCWHMENEPQNVIVYFRHIWIRSLIFRFAYGIIFQIISISMIWKDLPKMTEHGVSLFYHIIAFVKLLTVFGRQKRLRSVIDTLDLLHEPEVTHEKKSRRILIENNLACDKFTKLTVVFWYAVVIFITCTFVYMGLMKRSIPFRRWLPYDFSASPMFELTLAFTSFVQIFDMNTMPFCDLILVVLVAHMVAQFRILRCKVEQIRRLTVRRVKRSKIQANDKFGLSTIISLTVIQPRAEVRQSQFPGDGATSVGRVGGKKSFKEKVRLGMESALKDCIKHHQILLRLTNEVQSIFYEMLIFQVIIGGLTGMFALYISTLADHIDFMVSTIGIALSYFTSTFFILCFFSTRLADESLSIHDAVYACDWFTASESFKQSMRIVMSRAVQPLSIRAAGLTLSRRTFRSVCKLAYYTHMMLFKMYHGEKIIKKYLNERKN